MTILRRNIMEGHVRKRGSKWYYSIEIAAVGGKRKRVERVGGRTKKEAEEALRIALQNYQVGFVDSVKVTLEDYLNDWLENQIKKSRKINTYNRYKSIIDRSLVPHIGGYKINKLPPKKIHEMLIKEKDKGLSNTTVQNIYGVLNAALNQAVKFRMIRDNPCKYVERPKRDKFDAGILTIEEFQKFTDSLDTKKYNGYIMDLATNIVMELGLRRGELAGLTWDDFDENTLTIRNNLIYSNGKTYLETPKTLESERTIYVSDHLKGLLVEHRVLQDENKELYGEHYKVSTFNNVNYDFIMTWKNGHYVHPLYYSTRFKKLLEKISINRKIRFHDLRHSNATLLLSQGVDFKTIQARLGHADINTTLNIYSHISMEMQKKATQKIESILSVGKSLAK